MKKNHGKVTFKPNNQEQAMLLPPRLEELIPEEHLVRVVNGVVEKIDIRGLVEKHKGGGTSAYHPISSISPPAFYIFFLNLDSCTYR